MTSRSTRLASKDKMLKKILRKTLVIFLCQALAYAPLVNAAQLSLPSGDLIAPEITQEIYIDKVKNIEGQVFPKKYRGSGLSMQQI